MAARDVIRSALRKRAFWIAFAFVVGSFLGSRRILEEDTTDLDTCVAAAREMFGGEDLDLYRSRDELAPYPYPPVVALGFAAGLGVAGETGLKVLFGLLQGAATAALFFALSRAVELLGVRATPARWLGFVFLFGRTVTQNFTHGQLSLLVATLVTAGVVALARGARERAGAAFGTAAALKIVPGLFGVFLLATRRWRALAATVGAFVFLVLVLPWPFLGADHLRHLQDFTRAVLLPAVGEESAASGVWQARGHSAFGAFPVFADVLGLPRSALAVYLVALAAASTWGIVRVRSWGEPARTLLQGSFVLLAMALLAPLSNVYHLAVLALPGLLFCLGGPGRGARAALFAAAAVGLALAMPLRQKDLLGRELWRALDHSGLLHLSLVVVLVWLLTMPEPGRPRPSP